MAQKWGAYWYGQKQKSTISIIDPKKKEEQVKAKEG